MDAQSEIAHLNDAMSSILILKEECAGAAAFHMLESAANGLGDIIKSGNVKESDSMFGLQGDRLVALIDFITSSPSEKSAQLINTLTAAWQISYAQSLIRARI